MFCVNHPFSFVIIYSYLLWLQCALGIIVDIIITCMKNGIADQIQMLTEAVCIHFTVINLEKRNEFISSLHSSE